ncbi:MAG TPA: hypothetical protein DEW46_08985 [Verrucomicrobia bacterium]|nr:hypothetical protein [Verrucomicrobiota bacterium]
MRVWIPRQVQAGAVRSPDWATAEGFPDPDGEDSRRGAEAQRRRGPRGGNRVETSELFSATALVSGKRYI